MKKENWWITWKVCLRETFSWIYLNTFYSNDDISGNQIPIWRNPLDIRDDILHWLIANLLGRSHIDRVSVHCMLHSLNSISNMFHDHCSIYTNKGPKNDSKKRIRLLIYIRLEFFLFLKWDKVIKCMHALVVQCKEQRKRDRDGDC